MIVWPRRRTGDATAAVERLAARRGALLRANVVALVACGVLLAIAPSASAGLVARPGFDPSVSGSVVAFSTSPGEVVVRTPSGVAAVFAGASQPALSGDFLAYVDGQGIRVVRWRNGSQVARIANPNASRPALDWPNLAFVYRASSRKRLIVRNLATGRTRRPAKVPLSADLGRPSLRHGRLAWHVVTRRWSGIYIRTLATRGARTIARTRIGRLTNPSVWRTRVIWVDERSGVTRLRVGSVRSRRSRVLTSVRSRSVSYWTTSLSTRRAYLTRWSLGSGAAEIHSRRV